jgi:hypothetical protein
MKAVTSASSGSTLALPHHGQVAMGAAGVALSASSDVDPPRAPASDSAQSQFIAITSAAMIRVLHESVKCIVCIAAMLSANACEAAYPFAGGLT